MMRFLSLKRFRKDTLGRGRVLFERNVKNRSMFGVVVPEGNVVLFRMRSD